MLVSVLVRWYQGADMTLKTEILNKKQFVESSSTRNSPRIRLQVPVFVRGTDASGAEFIELTKTLNISATGACIASAHILRPEQTVHLTIPAPTPTSSSLIPNVSPPISSKVFQKTVYWAHGPS